MNENNPKISVILPVYNQSNLISNAINSIRNQTFQDWELIIIDDGSDNTNKTKLKQIIKSFNDSRIKLIWEAHNGLVAARNVGNQFAKADIIAVQDADDLSMPDRLEKCYKEIKTDVDIVYHGAYINMWDAQFQCIGRKYLPAEEFSKKKLLKGQYIPGWPVYKKAIWKAKPFRMETQFMYDWMMYLDWAFAGFKFKNINEGLYEYVRHENSASITFEKDGRRKKSYDEIKKIIKKEYDETIN